ncbi:methylated-DNA--[protein]-cysteine S-methyltransferase [Alcaligenaceae bacterium]|nr:methylated-DNA--[protein]-cysteine S-methyltransferase [Alcaligenaceae bacterium]
MALHAQFISLLGPILLSAERDQLTGLYFIGQSDCPVIDGLDRSSTIDMFEAAEAGKEGDVPCEKAVRAGMNGAIAGQSGRPDGSGPSSGMHAGMPIKDFKIRRRDLNHDLFSRENMLRTSGETPDKPLAVKQGAIVPLQDNTPAATHDMFCEVHSQLQAYFEGRREVFTVPMLLQGSSLQKRVWEALLTIPYGEYVSYGDVAVAAGFTRQHSRAVGKAVGQNPISIMVPCHRVLSGTGRLNGYSGGLDRKVTLLEIEGFDVY